VTDVARPGATLLQSLITEEHRGQPGPARDAALAAAQADAANAPIHQLDAVLASLVAGEPRRALQLLSTTALGDDPVLAARAHACRAWASQLDKNWYPGGVGAELADDALTTLTLMAAPTSNDPETRLLEAVVSRGPVPLLSRRATLWGTVRTSPLAAAELLGSTLTQLETFKADANAVGAPTYAWWAQVAQADLAWRAGHHDAASESVTATRQQLAVAGDVVAVANTHLVEGDWWATPASSPESLGFDLAVQPAADAMGAMRDLARADSAYRSAGAALAGLDEPRAAGAVALRLAHVAAQSGDFAGAESLLAQAGALFERAGEFAAVHLVTVHRLVLDLAMDRTAATRLSAGSGWNLAPRGPIADIVTWATTHGSASFGTGLGRLLERAGDAWKAAGAFERAAVAYSCAVPLIGLSGALAPGRLLAALASVDAARGFAARTAVRLEQAAEHLPPAPPPPHADPMRWMEHLELLMSITQTQTNRVTSMPTPSAIRGLTRVLARMRELAALAGHTASGSTSPARPSSTAVDDIAAAQAAKGVAELMADANGGADAMAAPFLAQMIPILTDQIGVSEVLLEMSRGRIAQRAGWTDEARRAFDTGLALAERIGPDLAWLAIIVLIVAGRDDEARARFLQARAAGLMPDDMLGSLAVRVHAYDIAQQLFGELSSNAPTLTWPDLLDRAELALERGRPDTALSIATMAIDLFESQVGLLPRDPDRLAATDDIKVPSLYLVACRACDTLARTPGRADQVATYLDRCLELIDRSRSLALLNLLDRSNTATSADTQRTWQETATNWSTAFDRLRAAYEADDAGDRQRSAAALTEADNALATVEAELAAVDAGLLTRPLLPPRLDPAAVRNALANGACLIEYLLVSRDLFIVAVTGDGVITRSVRLAHPGIEPQINRLWQACADGAAHDEATELGHLLLDPVGDILRTHRRVLIVPFAALGAVPFHVLRFGDAPFGQDHIISYLPSAALLARSAVDAPLHGEGAVVVGDPAFEPTAHPDLVRLPAAAVEARVVASIHGIDALLADSATEAMVRPLLTGRSIVHLAAHGRLDEVAPSASSIILSGHDELTVADLIGMRVDADLVVLSACDTGRGAASLGGDLVGLARGLIVAGVRRCVVSLWPVDDMAACVTMAAFHRRLAAGAPPAEALHAAQGEVRALSADDLASRYRDLGGTVAAGDRSLRRGPSRVRAAEQARQLIALDPEFVDDAEEDPADDSAETSTLDGRLERIWAPFVLIGA
jgi:CHAT domain-containing protein